MPNAHRCSRLDAHTQSRCNLRRRPRYEGRGRRFYGGGDHGGAPCSSAPLVAGIRRIIGDGENGINSDAGGGDPQLKEAYLPRAIIG